MHQPSGGGQCGPPACRRRLDRLPRWRCQTLRDLTAGGSKAATRDRHGVPAFQPVPASHRVGQCHRGTHPCQGRQESRSGGARGGSAGAGRAGGQGARLSGAAVGRPAAASRDRQSSGDEPEADAVRRAHLRTLLRACRRSPGGDEKACLRRHDDGGGHPRDGFRPRGRQSTRLHGRRYRRGERPPARCARQPATRTHEGVSVQGPLALMPASTPDPVTPLWRAAQVFRLLSCLYALGFQIAITHDLDRPAIGWLLFAVLVGWSIACAIAYLNGFGRRSAWVLAELAIVVALMLSTEFVASDQWALNNQSWPTTLWATNATISAAILLGPIYGMLSGVAIVAASTLAKGVLTYDLGRNATVVIELAVGLGVGMAAQTARRAHTDLERAARLAARTEERERLSRQVHDGAIQVLALVSRRGREIGGETAQLAELAGEQERALRRLVSSADAEPRNGELTDIGALLRQRASDRVSVSVPADPVLLEATVAEELAAAAGNALDN